jgi:hypothetical protein
MPLRCLIDISHSFSRRYWPILPVIGEQRRGGLLDVAQHVRERIRGDVGVVAKRQQHLLLALELLQQVGLQVGAPRHFEDLEDGQQRDVVIERVGAGNEMARALEQVLQAQQRPDAFIERILVADHARAPVSGRSGNSAAF